MKRKITLTAVQKEWLARILLVLVFVGLPMLLNAQSSFAGEDAEASKVRQKIVTLFTTILTTVAIAVILIKPGYQGIVYALHGDDERGQEAMNKLKAGISRVVIGCGIALSVGIVGNMIVKALV